MKRSFSEEPLANDALWRKNSTLPDTMADTEIIEGTTAAVLAQAAMAAAPAC